MAIGAIAKEAVTRKIMEAFGSDFVAEQDKKLYVWADDGGEKVQIAISMTCPKTPIGVSTVNTGLDFEAMVINTQPSGFQPAEISEEEKKNIDDLMTKLGLI